MGLSTKQVSGDQELDWSPALLQSGTLELPKPPAARRQQNPLQLEPLKCPRCDSINTKFCYYNNYNKSQPRHFCKACKRHWTKGGTLRNVPVGGGRKNKRIKRTNSGAGSNRPKNQMGTESQPQSLNFPLRLDNQPLIRPPLPQNDSINSFTAKILGNNGGFMGLTLPVPQNQGLQFSFSNLGNFDTNPSSIPCFQSSIDYKYESKFEAVEDRAITTLMANSSSVIDDNQTWEVPSASSNVMDLPNYWNWNDMVSADLNIPWDDDDDNDNTENQPTLK